MGRWRKSVFGAMLHGLGPPTDAMRELAAAEVSWGSEDTGIHDTAKVYALYLWVFKPSQFVAHFGLFLPQGTVQYLMTQLGLYSGCFLSTDVSL